MQMVDEDGATLLIHLHDKSVLLLHPQACSRASRAQEDEDVGSAITSFLMSGAF